ncbi:MAG: hypothetical protein IJV40_16965, partial [Oscillospiraceae bacterium]|nr:hypothetical protein [Oscillospiraceae bacterium]
NRRYIIDSQNAWRAMLKSNIEVYGVFKKRQKAQVTGLLRHSALNFLAIHKVSYEKFALIGTEFLATGISLYL